jgi:hypothetical protein
MGADVFDIVFTESALADMALFRKREQSTILDRCQEQLSHEPHVETRNRKKLRPNAVAQWELRIDAARVFYESMKWRVPLRSRPLAIRRETSC